jgi:hypothetical protein
MKGSSGDLCNEWKASSTWEAGGTIGRGREGVGGT